MTSVHAVTKPPGEVLMSGQQLLVTGVHGHRDWSTGLFGCFSDITTCLLGYFCLPCCICKLATRTGDCCCMPACVPNGTVAIRTKIRTMGGIQGTTCNDCLVLTCCQPCAVCQMHRELDNMGIP